MAASSPRLARCVAPSGAGLNEPATLTGLLNCQRRRLEEAHEAYFHAREADVPDRLQEAWQDQQEREMRSYVARHPERAAEGKVESSSTELKLRIRKKRGTKRTRR